MRCTHDTRRSNMVVHACTHRRATPVSPHQLTYAAQSSGGTRAKEHGIQHDRALSGAMSGGPIRVDLPPGTSGPPIATIPAAGHTGCLPCSALETSSTRHLGMKGLEE
mgnify:CR=1 FL=1